MADLALELSAAAGAATTAEPPLLMPGEAQAWIEAARLADTQERFFASVPLLFARAFKSL